MGVIDYKQLSGCRRYAIVIIVVVAAVITPSGDPISMLALGDPDVRLLRDLHRDRLAREPAPGQGPANPAVGTA